MTSFSLISNVFISSSDNDWVVLSAKRNACPGGLLLVSSNICREVRSDGDFDPVSQDSLTSLLMPTGLWFQIFIFIWIYFWSLASEVSLQCSSNTCQLQNSVAAVRDTSCWYHWLPLILGRLICYVNKLSNATSLIVLPFYWGINLNRYQVHFKDLVFLNTLLLVLCFYVFGHTTVWITILIFAILQLLWQWDSAVITS